MLSTRLRCEKAGEMGAAMGYATPMTDVDASRDMPQAAIAPPMRIRLGWAIAGAAALGAAAFALWSRFGEGVYAQMLLNAVIACF